MTAASERVLSTRSRPSRTSFAKRLDEFFYSQGKLVEAQRLEQRTRFDHRDAAGSSGFCKGIENYTRHLSGAKRPGAKPPPTLIDYLPSPMR